jgi:hypothetical protein
VEPYRRQIICQLPADPHRLTITQQKRYCSRCPLVIYMRETRGYDRRIKTRLKTCIGCGCRIYRGLRCGPCRDVADERRRQAAYAAKKQAKLIAS